MPKITSQNNFSIPPSAQPYQTPSLSSDHRGRRLTQVTASAIGKLGSHGMQSQTCVQHSASQVQPIHQPIQASGTQHVTVDIINRYLKMAKGLNDNHATARNAFINSENLHHTAEAYFSLRGLTYQGKQLKKWLAIAKCANDLPTRDCASFFGSVTENLVEDKRNGKSAIAEHNLECILAWHCRQDTAGQKISIDDFYSGNDLNCRTMEKYLDKEGNLRSLALGRIKELYENTSESIIQSAKQALRNDSANKYISATGKVTPEWKALLLGCQLDIVLDAPSSEDQAAPPSCSMN